MPQHLELGRVGQRQVPAQQLCRNIEFRQRFLALVIVGKDAVFHQAASNARARAWV